PAFPILARNLERWASGWTTSAPSGSLSIDSLPGTDHATVTSAAGGSQSSDLGARPAGITGLAPGEYTVTATGTGASHRQALIALLPVQGTAASAADGALDLAAWARVAPPRKQSSLSGYLIAL